MCVCVSQVLWSPASMMEKGDRREAHGAPGRHQPPDSCLAGGEDKVQQDTIVELTGP